MNEWAMLWTAILAAGNLIGVGHHRRGEVPQRS